MNTDKLYSPDLLDFWTVDTIETDSHSRCMDLTFLQSYLQSLIAQTPDGAYVARFSSNIATYKKRMQTFSINAHASCSLIML